MAASQSDVWTFSASTMSNDQSHVNDEFKLITYKRGKKSSKYKILPKASTISVPSSTQINKETASRRIQEAKTEIGSSDLFASALASLREGLVALNNPTVKEIICFGLGRIDLYNVSTVKVYDPIFSETDTWLLERFHCTVLKENYEGKYKVQDKCTTIFYMPHCPKQLTNNLLWANWGLDLNYCIIISNSFNLTVENTPKRDLNRTAEYIANIVPHILELALINSFRFFEIFNDTAIHVFPWSKIKLLSGDFWSFRTEPDYSDDDVEFIRSRSPRELANA